jgi:hypothetical protein
MDLTRADRIATAPRLLAELKSLRSTADEPRPGGPIGDCGRTEGEKCGMIDPQECRTHADPAGDDPALLNYAGPLTSRKQQLKAARRQRQRF